MSFPRYPAYKDSGHNSFGAVPANWNLTVIKRFATLQRGHDLTNSDRTDGPFPVVTSGGISGYHGEFKARAPGVVTGRYGTVGQIYYIDEDFWPHNTALYVLEFHGNVPRFAWYALHTVDFDIHASKAAVPGIDRNDIHELPIAVPPLHEQARIVEFLDRETAKIDALVAEQERLIELLKEKRQAVISHAVTKGLNPDAPMKPSGIEWLGDIPTHWQLTTIKRIATSIEQGWSPQCEGFPAETESEWGVLKVGCVNGGRFEPRENKLLPPDLEPLPSLSIAMGDLLISRANTRELVGGAAVATRDYPNLMLCDKLYRLRFDEAQYCPEFVSRYLVSSQVRGQIELDATGASASMVNISQSAILDLPIALPELAEQQEVVAAVTLKTAKLDTLTAEAERAIDLLQERRTALISAAVTGQIDVRSLSDRTAA